MYSFGFKYARSRDGSINSTALDFSSITNIMNFGDSIAFGFNATAGNSYRELLDTNYSTTNYNGAVSGKGVFFEIDNLHKSTFTQSSSGVFLEAGLNDLRRSSNYTTKNKIISCLKTSIKETFNSSQNVASGSSSVTRVGTFLSNFDCTLYGGVFPSGTLNVDDCASYSSTIGDTWTWSFTGDNVYVLFSASALTLNRGDCEVRIDGILVDTITDFNARWDGVSDGVYDNKKGPDTRFYTNLVDGAHTIEIKVTSAFSVVVDQIGVLDSPSNLGALVVIQIPYIVDYAKPGMSNASDALIDATNVTREAFVTKFKDLGYPIVFAKIMSTNGGLYDLANIDTDDVHPTNAGHLQIYDSIIRYII